MTAFSLRRYVAKETAISIVVNVVVSAVPSLMLVDASGTIPRPAHEVAVGLTPQFFLAALMSALVPSLLTCWRRARGRLDVSPAGPRSQAGRAAAVAAGLAAGSTILVLALIHLIAAPLAPDGMTSGAILALRVGQAALAAATVTPVAILLLFAGPSRRLHPGGSPVPR